MVLCKSCHGQQHKAARVVELADSLDSGSSVHSGRAGSSPASRTKRLVERQGVFVLLFLMQFHKKGIQPVFTFGPYFSFVLGDDAVRYG